MKRLLILFVAFVAITTLVGCDTKVQTVVVLGDSISALSSAPFVMQWERDDTYLPVTNAIVGAGLCDASEGADAAYWQTRIPTSWPRSHPMWSWSSSAPTMGAVPRTTHTASTRSWPGCRPTSRCSGFNVGDRAANAAELNGALAAAPSRHRNLQILDYSTHFAGHPEWFVSATSVHPNAAGQAELARWLLSQLRAAG